MKNYILFISLLSFVNVSPQINLQIFGPNSFHLGKSFDIFNIENSYSNDLFSTINQTDSEGVQSDIYYSLIYSKDSYYRALGINVGVEASFLGLIKSNNSYTQNESSFYDERNLTICLYGKSNYGKFSIKNSQLSPLVEQLRQNPSAFKNAFGDFYVSSVTKAQMVYVFVTINQITKNERNDMMANFNVGGNLEIFSADAKASLTRIISSINDKSRIQINISTFDKGDFSKSQFENNLLSDTNFSANAVNSILKYMKDNFSLTNAGNINYGISNLGEFINKPAGYYDILVRGKLPKYQKLSLQANKIGYVRNGIDEILKSRNLPLLKEDDLTFLSNTNVKLSEAYDDDIQALANCRDSDCQQLSNCCNLTPILVNDVDQLKLEKIYKKCLYPLASFSLNPAHVDTWGIISRRNNIESATIFEKTLNIFQNLNVENNPDLTYKFQGNLIFTNYMYYGVPYTVILYINDTFICKWDMQPSVPGKTETVLIQTEPIPFNKKYNNKAPEKISIEATSFFQMNGNRANPVLRSGQSSIDFTYGS